MEATLHITGYERHYGTAKYPYKYRLILDNNKATEWSSSATNKDKEVKALMGHATTKRELVLRGWGLTHYI